MAKVAVVIPSYNTAEYICGAVNSALRQTYRDSEVIVVDDGSTDNTLEVLQQYGAQIRCISQSNQGLSAARNAAIAASDSEYVAFLDSDDLWLPQKLDLQVRYMEAHPEIGVTHTSLYFYMPDQAIVPFIKQERTDFEEVKSILTSNSVCPSSVLIRRSCLESAGCHDVSVRYAEDLELWLRYVAGGVVFHTLPETLLVYRVRAASLTSTNNVSDIPLRLLQKFFTQENLPEEIRRLEAESLGNYRMHMARAQVRSGNLEQFSTNLTEAFSLLPYSRETVEVTALMPLPATIAGYDADGVRQLKLKQLNSVLDIAANAMAGAYSLDVGRVKQEMLMTLARQCYDQRCLRLSRMLSFAGLWGVCRADAAVLLVKSLVKSVLQGNTVSWETPDSSEIRAVREHIQSCEEE